MNECEAQLVKEYPLEAYTIFKNSKTANNVTQLRFEGQGLDFHLDCADAFRHCYFNALNAQDVGRNIALLFSNAHECGGTNNDAQMDYFNNNEGHRIGQAFPNSSPFVIADRTCDRLKEGNLKVLEDDDDPDSALVSSFNCSCN